MWSRIQVLIKHHMEHHNKMPSHVLGQDHPTNILASQLRYLGISHISSIGMEQVDGTSRSIKKPRQSHPTRFKILNEFFSILVLIPFQLLHLPQLTMPVVGAATTTISGHHLGLPALGPSTQEVEKKRGKKGAKGPMFRS